MRLWNWLPTLRTPHSYQDVVQELISGLRNGSIVLAKESKEQQVDPTATNNTRAAAVITAPTASSHNVSVSASDSGTAETSSAIQIYGVVILRGTVSEAGSTVKVTVGGQSVNATVTDTTWSATVPTEVANGVYTISFSATDPVETLGHSEPVEARIRLEVARNQLNEAVELMRAQSVGIKIKSEDAGNIEPSDDKVVKVEKILKLLGEL
jgi:hypothetical protein